MKRRELLMNELLNNKLNQLKEAKDSECWYLVKHQNEFAKQCYLTAIFKEYLSTDKSQNLDIFLNKRVGEINAENKSLAITGGSRSLRVSAFYGLITMHGREYKNATITPAFDEICDKCSGHFENVDLYNEIIDRQIEKMYLSSDLDEKKSNDRAEFRLYPLMLLYKILIEIGHSTGEYKISMTEYNSFVITAKKFEEFIDTLIMIKLLRNDTAAIPEFEKATEKFDSRVILSLKQLSTLSIDDNNIELVPEKISEVSEKVFAFESNPDLFLSDNYFEFLGSTKSLMELGGFSISKTENNDTRLSIEWFQKQAEQLGTVDEEATKLYKEFREEFSPEALKNVEGVDLLHKIFLNETGNKNNLCYVLEYDKRYAIFGSVTGFANKYVIFYKSEIESWVTGVGKATHAISEDEAIKIGTKIRDELVLGSKIISDFGEIKELKQYADLYAKLFPVMPQTIGKGWVMKYFHMLYPELFPVFYSETWQKKVLDQVSIEADENSFIRMGQIALFVKQCGISNVAFSQIVHKIDAPVSGEELQQEFKLPYNFDSQKSGAYNVIVYGTPGCGKSYYVENELLPKCKAKKTIRTTFYQDYTNTDFVGQVMPKVNKDKSVTYEFNPGPFALALRDAIQNPEESIALVIEELNRGNAPSIFGDIFQLLDRDRTGKSQYNITNVNLQDYLNKYFEEDGYVFDKIYIPSNLYIVATMNTSDQNVFTLDTAFKRRWQFKKLRNIFKDDHEYKEYYIPGMPDITWKKLVTDINDFILNNSNELTSEDKQLGVYFIEKETLCEKPEECNDDRKKYKFSYKLLEYLWDDVAKFARPDWFGSDIKSLDGLIDAYIKNGKKVFVDGIIKEQSENQ